MADRYLENTYALDSHRLTNEEIVKSFSDFDYFTSHCQQIVDKNRRLVHMRLNRFQRMVFSELTRMVDPKTRLNHRHDVVFLKPRQVGATTGLISWVNYICAYVEGMENLNILHSFPVTDTIAKIYSQKVEPIITGVHPDIMPTIKKEANMSSSIRLTYQDILGVRRNNCYDLVSAGASSIRSGTVHIWLADEVGFYRHPDVLEDAVSGSMPDTGFSLVVYASTFEDKMGEYYRKKIEAARDNPDTWTLIFAPWFMVYPEVPMGIPISEVKLDDYDQKVIIPAMKECGLPVELWGDAITWYHQKRPRISNMQKEYPTTLDEVLALGENRLYFSTKSIERQKDNIEIGQPSRLVSDVQTNQISLLNTDASPLRVFRKPVAGHRYTITVDPILSVNEESDLFCASVWDMRNLEQVATYRAREMSQEDYADAIVSLAKVYNRAQICPEQNLSEAFVACVRALGYYNFYYIGKNERAKKIPGIRTTARSKEELLDRLALLLNNNRVIIHDPMWVEELGYFERIVKERADGSTTVKAMARKGKHDDTVTTLWVLAGMLDRQQLTGTRSHGIAFL